MTRKNTRYDSSDEELSVRDGSGVNFEDEPFTLDDESGNPLATTPSMETQPQDVPPEAQPSTPALQHAQSQSVTLEDIRQVRLRRASMITKNPLPPLRSHSLTHLPQDGAAGTPVHGMGDALRSEKVTRRAMSSSVARMRPRGDSLRGESPRSITDLHLRGVGASSPESTATCRTLTMEVKSTCKEAKKIPQSGLGPQHHKAEARGGAVVRRKRGEGQDTSTSEPAQSATSNVALVQRHEQTHSISTLFHRRKPVVQHVSKTMKQGDDTDFIGTVGHVEFKLAFGESDDRLGCTWKGLGKGNIVVHQITQGSLAERVGITVGMKLISIEGTLPRTRSEFEGLMGNRGSAMQKLRDGGEIAVVLDSNDLYDDTESTGSYDVEYEDYPFQESFEAVWLPCVMSCVAHTAFIQIPVVIHSVGLMWTLLIFLATILVSMLSLESISMLLSRQSLPETLQLGIYHILSRHVGTEYGGVVGILFLTVCILLNGVHAQGLGEAVYFYWDLESLCGCSDTEKYWVIRGTGFIIQVVVTFAIYFWELNYVSLCELLGVIIVFINYVLMVVGCLLPSDDTAWKHGDSPSFDVFTSNWITDFDPALPNPDNSNLTVIECLCRVFPSALSILIVLGRATDLENPQEEMPRAIRRAMAWSWAALVVLVFCISFSLSRDLQDEDLGMNGTLSHWLFVSNATGTTAQDGGDVYLYYYHLFVAATVEAEKAGVEAIAPDNWSQAGPGGTYYFEKNPNPLASRWRPRYDVIDSGFLLPKVAEGGVAFELFVAAALLIQCLQTMAIGPRVVLSMNLDHASSFLSKNMIPQLSWAVSGRGFPTILCGLLAAFSVLMGQYLYNLVTIVSLVCLGIINGVAATAVFTDSVKYEKDVQVFSSKWKISLCGFVLCGVVMFYISWYVALAASIMAILSAKYFEMKIDVTYWGEGVKGMQLQHALDKLLTLEVVRDREELHDEFFASVKQQKEKGPGWRPQIMVLTKIPSKGEVLPPRILSVADQLKAARGLVIIAGVLEGDAIGSLDQITTATEVIKKRLAELRTRGFVKVVASKTYLEGFTFMMQGLGLGELSPNTVVVQWPDDWRIKDTVAGEFTSVLRVAHSLRKALVVLKGVKHFPCTSDPKDEDFLRRRQVGEYIDLWWLLHDGGLELLIAFVLRQHTVWREAILRIIILVPIGMCEDDKEKIMKSLEEPLQRLQIDCRLIINPVRGEWITEFTTHPSVRLPGVEEEEEEEGESQHHPQPPPPQPPAAAATVRQQPAGEHRVQIPQQGAHLGVTPIASPVECPGRNLSRVSSSVNGFDGFPMVDLVGELGDTGFREGGEHNTALYHFECLNQLIQESSAQSDLVLINLPDCDRFLDSEEFMLCTEQLLKNIRKAILFSGTEEQVILKLW